MLVAAGPFTTSDSLLYEPLADLMKTVQSDKPDLLVLVSQVHTVSRQVNNINIPLIKLFLFVSSQLGPFVDSKHDQIIVSTFGCYVC